VSLFLLTCAPDATEVVAGETGTLAIVSTPTSFAAANSRADIFLRRARVKRRKAKRAAAAVILANGSLALRENPEKGTKTADEGPDDIPLDTFRVTRT
jgi:hypothetical protein